MRYAIVIMCFFGLASTASADALSDCTKGATAEEMISGCSKILKQSRFRDKHNLSIIYNNRGAAFGSSGDREKAIDDLTEAIRLNPKNSTALRNRVSNLAALGRFEEALEDANSLIRMEPRSAEYYVVRAELHERNNELEEALND